MRVIPAKRFSAARLVGAALSVMFITLTPNLGHTYCNAQTDLKVRNLTTEIVPEMGSPVEITSLSASVELDPFGAPAATRTYITYRNLSHKAIAAVKFRVGFFDSSGRSRGTFHAPHACLVPPGATASEKWRREGVHPGTETAKARVLLVKFDDGATWASEKMKGIAVPHQDFPTSHVQTSAPVTTPANPPPSQSEPTLGL